MSTSSHVNGELISIKSPIDGSTVLAILVAATSTPSGDIISTLMVAEGDDPEILDFSYLLTPEVEESILESYGDAKAFLDAHNAEYQMISKAAKFQLGTVALASAILKLKQPGAVTTQDNLEKIIAASVHEGQERVRILQQKIDSIADQLRGQ